MALKSPIFDAIMSSMDSNVIDTSNIQEQISPNTPSRSQNGALELQTNSTDTNTQVIPSKPSGDDLADFNTNYAKTKTKYSQENRDKPGCSDCSAYTRDYYKSKGKNIGGWTGSQWDKSKPTNQPTKGDLVFWDTKGNGMNHVGIYDGKGGMSHFSTSGLKSTSIRDYGSKYNFLGFRRPS